MNYILFDDHCFKQLLPFTHTRPVADIRCGIVTMRERWQHFLNGTTSSMTEAYLSKVFPIHFEAENVYINAAVFANEQLADAILNLSENTALYAESTLIAFRTKAKISTWDELKAAAAAGNSHSFSEEIFRLENVWDIFNLNAQAIQVDYQWVTKGKTSQSIPEGVQVIGDISNIFIEEGAQILPSIINVKTGVVYIGKDAEIWEGCMIRGSLAMCEHSVLKMGAKVYGGTTIGVHCKIGGEVSNVVCFDYSNKGHDGFVGNAVIGSWCNLGADTNASNLKNNYDVVKVWSELEEKLVNTSLQFVGLLMGDHSKCGINTMFNTGTVVGVSANIYGGDFPDKFIPSFSWGGASEMMTYRLDKAIDTANRMMERRGLSLTEEEKEVFAHIFYHTTPQRADYKV